jgi:hypothetical protein
MASAKKAKPKRKKKPVKGEPKPELARPAREESDESVDYGGLPARDFKKNLGCG